LAVATGAGALIGEVAPGELPRCVRLCREPFVPVEDFVDDDPADDDTADDDPADDDPADDDPADDGLVADFLAGALFAVLFFTAGALTDDFFVEGFTLLACALVDTADLAESDEDFAAALRALPASAFFASPFFVTSSDGDFFAAIFLAISITSCSVGGGLTSEVGGAACGMRRPPMILGGPASDNLNPPACRIDG